MMRQGNGVTLIEILVGIFITSILGMGIYSFLSGARTVSSISAAKSMLNREATVILRQLERDISSSRGKVVEEGGKKVVKKKVDIPASGDITLEVPRNDIADDATFFDQNTADEDALYVTAKYQLNGKDLIRVFDGNSRKLSSNVKSLKFDTTASGNLNETYDGKVQAILTLSARPDGITDEIEIEQRLTVSVRQAADKDAGKTWKQRIDATDASSF